MKKLLIPVLIFMMIISTSGCAVSPDNALSSASAAVSVTPEDYKYIKSEDVKKMMDGGDDIIIVDVRTAEEYSGGHLEGAVNIPVETISDEKPAELPDLDALIIIYCRTGNRTRTAYEKLAALGYTNVYDMGGIVDWPYETITDSETAAVTDALPSGDATETDPASPGGILSTFSSTDIAGNPVDETIFSGKKLTMVNIWATFCGPCINEMPELGALNTEYADKGFQIVGIVVDVIGNDGTVMPDMVDTVQEIIDLTGADYLHILPSEDLAELINQAEYVPTTIFVDENGSQVEELYVGSRSAEDWAMIIENLLKEVG
jgi:rhodanese-related sulfurtransferase/thiol-disulfide isomerase/thioredoxin